VARTTDRAFKFGCLDILLIEPSPQSGHRVAVYPLRHILLDDPTPPSTEELAAAAAEEDRRYPECPEALYRRQHPGWLEERVAFSAEYHRGRRWQEIERYLNGGSGLSPERSEWLCRNEELIQPLVEEAKAEHVARYSEGGLKRALARNAG
jgi:hypothetical protein